MSLPELLSYYAPHDDCEAAMVVQLRDFLGKLKHSQTAFGRELAGVPPRMGHITGSAWVINKAGSCVVLVHHAKLQRWVPPGGHCDDDADVQAVALREAREQIGLTITPLPNGVSAAGIFDVDVHTIPEYWNTPEHLHYDVRFVFMADGHAPPITGSELHAARWVGMDEAARLNNSSSIERMIAKTRVLASRLSASEARG